MEPATIQRKLTTIVLADIAGYSRLMSRDEEDTHARCASLSRELVEPAIAAHGGLLVKKTGDGFLAEFPSVVEAIRCAMEIQDGAAQRNVGVAAADRLAFRIGINTGDVIVEPDDIYGDGVNVAARLESLAEPGGIVISRAVRDHLGNKIPVSFEDLGAQSVKNIALPVRAFRVRPQGADSVFRSGMVGTRKFRLLAALGVIPFAVAVGSGSWWLTRAGWMPNGATARPPAAISPSEPARRLSLVVLPFANLGGDPIYDYLPDGITEGLTTDLSRAVPGSFIVARGTAFTYKGKPLDPSRIGRDLNVRYVISGSVIADATRVRVNAQLVDAETNVEVWAERFDKNRSALFEIQDQIVARLSRAAGLQVIDVEARRSERSASPTAIDFVMRGQAMINRPASRETIISARDLFQRALEYVSNNPDALAGVAMTYVFEVLNGYYAGGRDERLRNAEALIQRALTADPGHLTALKVHAAWLRAKGLFEEAIAASKAVIAQNPGEPWAYKEVGFSELYLGRLQDSLQWFEKADQIGPRDPTRWIWLGAMGRVHFFLDEPESAAHFLRLSVDANPQDPRAHALLAAVYALWGRSDDARAELENCLRLQPIMTVHQLFADWSVPLEATSTGYRRQHDRLRDGLRIAGMPER